MARSDWASNEATWRPRCAGVRGQDVTEITASPAVGGRSDGIGSTASEPHADAARTADRANERGAAEGRGPSRSSRPWSARARAGHSRSSRRPQMRGNATSPGTSDGRSRNAEVTKPTSCRPPRAGWRVTKMETRHRSGSTRSGTRGKCSDLAVVEAVTARAPKVGQARLRCPPAAETSRISSLGVTSGPPSDGVGTTGPPPQGHRARAMSGGARGIMREPRPRRALDQRADSKRFRRRRASSCGRHAAMSPPTHRTPASP